MTGRVEDRAKHPVHSVLMVHGYLHMVKVDVEASEDSYFQNYVFNAFSKGCANPPLML